MAKVKIRFIAKKQKAIVLKRSVRRIFSILPPFPGSGVSKSGHKARLTPPGWTLKETSCRGSIPVIAPVRLRI
jgi:hypothetical protein